MDGPAGSSHSNGFGDIRGAVRVSPELFSIYDLPVAVRAGFKVSGSEFPVDATEISLSEGQRDIDLSVESGWSSLEHSIYAVGWIGYRWRAENEKVEYEPDNEIFAHAAVGGTLAAFHLKLGVDALWGADLVEQGIVLPSARRRLVQLLPTIGTEVGGGSLEVTVPISVSGRNLSVSRGVSLGYRIAWGDGWALARAGFPSRRDGLDGRSSVPWPCRRSKRACRLAASGGGRTGPSTIPRFRYL